MDWTQTLTTVGSILIPVLAVFGGGFVYLANRLRSIEKNVAEVNTRLSRLEGAFEERGKWESKGKGTGT